MMERTNYSDSSYVYFRYGSLFCGVAIVPVAILGIIGNCIAASVFRRQRHAASSTYSLYPLSNTHQKESRSSINILLIGLTIVDTVLLILATPLCSTMAIYNFHLENGHYLLSAIGYMTLSIYPISMMAQCASVWTMVLISMERYMAICRPLSNRIFESAGKMKKAFGLIVIAAIVYNLCRFGEYRLNDWRTGIEPLLRGNEMYVGVYLNWAYFTLIFALPFLVLLIANSLIARTIIKSRHHRRLIVPLSQHNRCEHRTALMMAAVVLAYMACNTLALLLNGWEAFGGQAAWTSSNWSIDGALFSFLSDLNNLLIEAHSSLTFLVYFRFSGHFRGFVYHQCRFVWHIWNKRNKSGGHLGQRRPTVVLVEKSRNLSLILTGEKCDDDSTMGRTRSASIAHSSSHMQEKYRQISDVRRFTTIHRPVALRKSTYVTIARGSLESRLDPFLV